MQTLARLLVHGQRKFTSDTLGSTIKQSSLMYISVLDSLYTKGNGLMGAEQSILCALVPLTTKKEVTHTYAIMISIENLCGGQTKSDA